VKRATGLLTAALGACHPNAGAPPVDADEARGPTEAVALEPETPTNRQPGEQLDAVIPLFDGGALALASLRGRVVLLELSASWERGWNEAHEHHASLANAYGERLAIVVVSADADGSVLESSLIGPFTLGWDPQGALAARLRVAGFPTFLVLDADGRIVAIHRGFDEHVRRALHEEIDRLLGTGPANASPPARG
jgi:hypothetical protein